MTVKDLIHFLRNVPEDVVVVIGGEVVSGAEVVWGRRSANKSFGQKFSTNIAEHKKRDSALMFTDYTENSGGDWRHSVI